MNAVPPAVVPFPVLLWNAVLGCSLIAAAPLRTAAAEPGKEAPAKKDSAKLSDSGERPREQIGEVLAQPVYRDEIGAGEGMRLHSELHRLFSAPVLRKYRQAHRAEIEPTEKEIEAATAYFDQEHQKRMEQEGPEFRARLKAVEKKLAVPGLTKEDQQKLETEKQVLESRLKPPGRFFARFVLSNWKFQRHLYDRYGGGRILWQQAGIEAFDATRQWLEAHEKKGDFKISDPALRSSFYEYWTTMKHPGGGPIDDKERIRAEFLEPEWAP
jgi:hypothetical protein